MAGTSRARLVVTRGPDFDAEAMGHAEVSVGSGEPGLR
jgi:hypothetical protein